MTRRFLLSSVVVVGILALGYLVWFAFLNRGSTEGDIPEAAAMRFPAGTDVVNVEEGCGSGGCWSVFTLRPAPESSGADLVSYLEITFGGQVPGTFFDPRTLGFTADTSGNSVVVSASYWSFRDEE